MMWARYAKREMWHEVGERLPGMVYTVCGRRIPDTARYRDDRPDEHLTCWNCQTRKQWQGYARERGDTVLYPVGKIPRLRTRAKRAVVPEVVAMDATSPAQKVCCHVWKGCGFGERYRRCATCGLLGIANRSA